MFRLLPADNWEYSLFDILRALSGLINPRTIPSKITIPGVGDCLPIISGRAAVITALKALKLPSGARIATPLYNCPVVTKAIVAAGYTPQFIDMDPTTYCMSIEDLSLKVSKVDAIIAVHMFGNICDMDGIIAVAKGRPIIEDCAQSIGSKIDDKSSGSFGNIAFFSFRSSKYLSVGEGGALFSKDKDLYKQIEERINLMPEHRPFAECNHIFKTYMRSKLRSRPFFGIFGYPLWNLYNKKVDVANQTPITVGRMYKADMITTDRRIKTLDYTIEKQRTIADFYNKKLSIDHKMLYREKNECRFNRLFYPINFPSKGCRDFVADFLLKRKITTIKPYQNCAEVAEKHSNYTNDCPITEKIAKQLLVIPSYYRLKRSDMSRVADNVNKGYRLYTDIPGNRIVEKIQM